MTTQQREMLIAAGGNAEDIRKIENGEADIDWEMIGE
jgi:hypothetical protein